LDRIKELNQEIAKDKSLGKGFCIGHSYFCNTDECTDEWMQDVVDFDVLPMLAEYWFDDTDKLQRWENILHGVFAMTKDKSILINNIYHMLSYAFSDTEPRNI